MRCRTCSTVIPHHARFCPKCGGAKESGDPLKLPRAPGAHPSRAPIPRVGKLFIASLVAGLALVGTGIGMGVGSTLIAGLVLLGVVAVVAVVGHHVS